MGFLTHGRVSMRISRVILSKRSVPYRTAASQIAAARIASTPRMVHTCVACRLIREHSRRKSVIRGAIVYGADHDGRLHNGGGLEPGSACAIERTFYPGAWAPTK